MGDGRWKREIESAKQNKPAITHNPRTTNTNMRTICVLAGLLACVSAYTVLEDTTSRAKVLPLDGTDCPLPAGSPPWALAGG
jgi:hypothetical protein